jgi:hypothetical protein
MRSLTQIIINDDGFNLVGRYSYDVPWSSVAEIVAFKADLWAVDQICLGIRVEGSDEFLPIDEDSLGYNELVAEINWWSPVAFPAFAENWTRIWPPLPPTSSPV